jgi:hypothetical protein
MNFAREFDKIERRRRSLFFSLMSSFIKSRYHSWMLVQGKVRGIMGAFHPRDAHQLLFIHAPEREARDSDCPHARMKKRKKQQKTRFDYKLLAASRRLSLSRTFSAACAWGSTHGSKPACPLSA